ncbi:MAG: histidinol dehydrogenase [Candidatus Dormibacteraeota bacterium]|nr:histidinol dehydrogenase [Candidatus Dormibacteraeota bacterium]
MRPGDGVGLSRFSAAEWAASPLYRRRLDFGGSPEQRLAVAEIVRRVAVEGDAALAEYGRRFDGWAPAPGETFAVPAGVWEAAAGRLPGNAVEALALAAARIRAFHAAQAFSDIEGPDGLRLLVRPVLAAGLYVPGGRAAYPSTVLMTAIPARVAGVRRVVLATPPAADGSVPDSILAAAAIAGVDQVYRVGGAQAIAALAHGTQSIPAVDVVAGPGNVYVMLAKREVFGAVGVDAIAGPTEIMVVADRSARPDYVAADLASQLEHDPMAWAVLVTDSAALADAVEEELTGLVERLDRAETVRAAHCCIVLAASIGEAMRIANDFGPEHLEIVTGDPEAELALVENAGAVFLGGHAPVSLGDYVIGPNHTLPTAGSARFSSPLGVYSFLKRTSVAATGQAELLRLAGAAKTLAGLEGLTAHANAIEVRAGGESG